MHRLDLPLQVKLERIAIIVRLSGGGDPIVQRIHGDETPRQSWVIRDRSIQRQCRLMSAMRPTAAVRATSPNGRLKPQATKARRSKVALYSRL